MANLRLGLRMFAWKSSNIENFIKLLLLVGNEILIGGHRLRFRDMIYESVQLF